MWRALFFAVGATLIIFGLQCLVVDHIVVANGTRVPGIVAKYLDGRGAGQAAAQSTQDPNFSLSPNSALSSIPASPRSLQMPAQVPVSGQTASSPPSANGSRFGPSRFADSQFSNTDLPNNVNYFGGIPFSNRSPTSGQQFARDTRDSNSQFSLAGYGGQTISGQSRQGQLGGAGVGQGSRFSPVTLGRGGSRIIKPTEWMPWGLLAIGTLVVLYTNSTGRGHSKD